MIDRCGSTATGWSWLSVKVDGKPATYRMDGPAARHRDRRRASDGRNRGRDPPRGQHQADGPLRLGRHALHAVRGRGLPPHHLLPRPARRPVQISRADGRRREGASRCCCRTATASRAATAATGVTGPSGRIRSPSPAICSRSSPATSKANRDSFTTMSGRKVDLAIWVREADLPKTQHAMDSLKLAMEWDEKVYGREYDLDQFNIVAVSDFNMGAMENKSLNIFNSAYVLADQETATDADFDNIARRRRARIFPQLVGRPGHLPRLVPAEPQGRLHRLSRPELLGRHRKRRRSSGSRTCACLRAVQFPEDQGPLAHPVRPDSYIEISNFYTATVYNKGAEVIRMFHTVLGPEKFRAGTDLYFERHDGEGGDLRRFRRGAGGRQRHRPRRRSRSGTARPARRRSARGSSMTRRRGRRRCISSSMSIRRRASPIKQPMPIPLQDRADRRARAGTRSAPSG